MDSAFPRSIKERVYFQILDKIIRGEFPKDRFLTESQLIDCFGVSRAPIREALGRLCCENVLRNIPRAGYQIVMPSLKEIGDAIRTRIVLETAGALDAMRKLKSADIDDLEALSREHGGGKSNRIPDLEHYWKDNREFHLKLVGFSGNALILEMTKKTMDILWLATAQYVWDEKARAFQVFSSGSHADIIRALRNKNEKLLASSLASDISSLTKLFHLP